MATIFLVSLVFCLARSFQSSDEQTDLDLYGPVGIKEFVLTGLRISGSRLGYRINFHEIDSAGKIFEDDSFEVYTDLLDHTIFCLGYRDSREKSGEVSLMPML